MTTTVPAQVLDERPGTVSTVRTTVLQAGGPLLLVASELVAPRTTR